MTYRNAKFLVLTGMVLLGSASMAHAETNNREVVRDTEGQIVHIGSGSCVRSKGATDKDVCGPQNLMIRQVAEVKKTRAITEFSREERTIYFAFNHFDLSPEATARLDTLVNTLKTDQSVKDAQIVGYADRIGSVSYNERLSQKRAETVRNYLIANGYTNAQVTKTRWVGKTEPSTSCPDAGTRTKLIACLQNDRRVEVEIGLRHDEQTPVTH